MPDPLQIATTIQERSSKQIGDARLKMALHKDAMRQADADRNAARGAVEAMELFAASYREAARKEEAAAAQAEAKEAAERANAEANAAEDSGEQDSEGDPADPAGEGGERAQ